MRLASGADPLAGTVGAVVAAAPQGPNNDTISPGLAGFVTVFLLALVVVLLMRSMVKHLRNVRYGPGPDGTGPAGSASVPPADPPPDEPRA
ncbi:MAG: hypothetical protein ACKVZ6_12825 [Kineosporiaceae bacterium]